jgi:tetratricopeptide (TPR) repeat protein
MTAVLRQSVSGGIALLAFALCIGAAPGGEPSSEETTATASELHYRGSEAEAMPFYERAAREYEQHHYAEAARLLEQAFAAHEHPLLAYNLGHAQRNAENYEAALTAYQNYIQLCPRDELINEVYISIGECLLDLNRRQEANEAFQHYLDLERDGESAAQAQRAIETGEAPSAQDRRDPDTVRQARELTDQAARLWEQEQFTQAAEVFLRGYERMPGMHEFLYNAGLCYLDAQAWDDAARTLRRYVETPGAEHDAWAFLGESYGEAFDFVEAVDAYERYLELEPHGDYANQARDFVNDTMPPPSETGVRRETGATPGEFERAEVDYNRGIEHFEAERYREAIQAFESAYEIVPSRVLVYNIGLCHSRLGEWQQGLACFERFLERDDQGMGAIAHLEAAECLIELNRPQDAIRHLDQFAARARESTIEDEEAHTARAEELRQRAQGGGTGGGATEGGTTSERGGGE